MASGESSGALTGAVSGAATGASVGGVYGAIAGAIIGGFVGGFSGSANDREQANQEAWARYNARLEYQTSMYNINSRTDLTNLNVASLLAGTSSEMSAISQNSQYNTGIILGSTLYNNSLMQAEMEDLWESLELDLNQLEDFRARERGGMVADQAASGTVIGEGSNEDAIIDQMTQESLDKLVVQHNADKQAANIENAMARGIWEGGVAIQQNAWEGELAIRSAGNSAMANAAGMLATDQIQRQADTRTANQALLASGQNIANSNSTYRARNTQAAVTGFFSGASRLATTYYGNKPVTSGSSTSAGSSLATGG